MALMLSVPQQTSYATSLSLQPSDVSGNQILAHFDSMPGNQPSNYGNTLFLWQTGAQIVPINTQPQSFTAIGTNQPNAAWLFMNLDVTSEPYLLAYAVGGDPSNIVSTVFIPASSAGLTAYTSMNATVTVTGIMSTEIAFFYAAPLGQSPLAQGDWVGLWPGQSEGTLYTTPPTFVAQISTTASQGNWGLNLVSGGIQSGTMYTLGYFKGGWNAAAPTHSTQTTLACSTTFFA